MKILWFNLLHHACQMFKEIMGNAIEIRKRIHVDHEG